MLYFIQNDEVDPILEDKIKSLGKNMELEDGWVLESSLDAKSLYDFLSKHNASMSIVVFGLDKKNYYGRYEKELWNFFK